MTSRLGMGKSLTFYYSVTHTKRIMVKTPVWLSIVAFAACTEVTKGRIYSNFTSKIRYEFKQLHGGGG